MELIKIESNASATFNYCMTTDALLSGTGNIKVGKSLQSHGVSPNALQGYSPGVNAGDPTYNLQSLSESIDVNQNVRIYNFENDGRIDIGAYEYQGEPFSFGIDPFAGDARSNAVSFVIDSVVYVGMGQDGENYFNDFWSYNHTANVWSQVSDFPGAARTDLTAFVIDGKAYVGLGKSASPTTYYSAFYEYTPETDSWKQLNNFEGGARYDAVSFVINDEAFVGTGGNADGELKDFWKYDLTSDSWSETGVFSGDQRRGATAFAINGKGYVSGGIYYDSYSVQLSDVQEYDPQTDTWSVKVFADGMNLSVYNATALVVGKSAFICYGNKDQVTKYTPETNEITNLGDVQNLGNDRWGAISFVLSDTAYFGLGFYSEGLWDTYYTKDIQSMNLPYAPNNITLSNQSIDENSPYNSVVGIFSTSDINSDDNFTYNLISGDGDTDNALFAISGDELLALTFNFEEKPECTIRVQTVDNTGNSFEKAFVIKVNDLNEAPSNITLSNQNITNTDSLGTIVAYLSATDEDLNDTLSFELQDLDGTSQQDNIYYSIVDTTLVLSQTITDAPATHLLNINVADAGGLSYSQLFQINVEKGASIKQLLEANGIIDIYPNPANDKLHIVLNNKDINLNRIVLMDSRGNQLFVTENEITEIDLSPYTQGLYLILLETDDATYFERILKQ